jgi:hypothetical protein
VEDVGRGVAGEVCCRQHVVGGVEHEGHQAFLDLLGGEVVGGEADGEQGGGVFAPVGEVEGDVEGFVGEVEGAGDGGLKMLLGDVVEGVDGVAEAVGEELADLGAEGGGFRGRLGFLSGGPSP